MNFNVPVGVVGIVLCLSAGVARAENWAEKMFSNRSHDFRIVSRGASSEHHFEFTNLYEEDIHVSGIRTSCGCTTPTITRESLQTHQTAAVVAKFNTESFVGQKSATITVIFDEPAYAEVQLQVQGYIRTDIAFDPAEADFGELKPGEEASREVTITRTGKPDWEILDVRSHCEHLAVSLSPPTRTASSVQYRMTIDMDGEKPEGDIRERLTLISNDRRFPTTEMAIVGRIRPTLSLSPASVSLGSVGATESASKRLVIRGETEFGVDEVLSADERLSFEIPPGRRKVHFIKMNFQGDGTSTPVSQQVRVVTDLDGKAAQCIVTGKIH